MTKHYTDERNVQIVISLLKAHGISQVVASPGTTNLTFVASIQQDPYFKIYSSVDERSAAYIACGLAEESGQPVVLTCTGATASRNYMSGLTEAFYRKLPVLAITSHRGDYAIGHLHDQQIDRRSVPNDIAMISVTVPLVKDANDENYCLIEASKAILALKRRGGGPAHINLFTSYSKCFDVKKLPPIRVINRLSVDDKLPDIKKGDRVAIFVGSHKAFTELETNTIDVFCECHNAVVFCDHTSGYKGKYRVDFALVCAQTYYRSSLINMDLLIHIGEVSGNAYGLGIHPKCVWRVSEDGEIRDTFKKLINVFEMSEFNFFTHYTDKEHQSHEYLKACEQEYEKTYSEIPELPFGNLWIAHTIHDQIPHGCNLHFGILNSLRSWNFFGLDSSIKTNCNVGGFGIDGGLSTLIGASIASPEKLCFGVFGDLAFFYDMNALGNRHVGNNLRIMVINNGRGTEFRLFNHPCAPFGDDADPYMAAAGHYGNKSPNLIKHYSEDLGFEYLSATDKQSFMDVKDVFLSSQMREKPVIFEVFTGSQDESDALLQITGFMGGEASRAGATIINTLRKCGGQPIIDVAKKILKK